EVGIECVSSTTLIAKLIEEEAMLGSISVVSSLTHGNVALSEIKVPKMRYHDNAKGMLAHEVVMPEGAMLVAISTKDDVEVVSSQTMMVPGNTAIVASDSSMLDSVRAVFKAL
ncbi:MAG: TrkA family potassium uptake protein, partial [Raoultibacter sp.]